MSKNLLAAIFVLVASGIATWLFLPLAIAPATTAPLRPTTTVVPIGPIQVDLTLVLLLIAAGVPFAAIVMAVLVRFLSGLAPAGASTPAVASASASRAAAPAQAAASTEEEEEPFSRKLPWLLLALVAIAVFVVLLIQVLPPGFTLF